VLEHGFKIARLLQLLVVARLYISFINYDGPWCPSVQNGFGVNTRRNVGSAVRGVYGPVSDAASVGSA